MLISSSNLKEKQKEKKFWRKNLYICFDVRFYSTQFAIK